MSQQGPGALDCKIRVRNYVLVANPSRWGQKVDRAVVQSPMLEINKNVSRVPVKRNKGEEQNGVDFLARNDIEKDSCSIYAKLYVKKDPFEVDAHGVALFNKSSQHSETTLDFKRGDRFWICVGANTHDFETKVPVINLRTYELGTIPIDSVCWFPRIEGPDGELWTLGGEIRKLKQIGVRKYSYWSWVICQRPDGRATVTKNVQIPSSYVTKENDHSILSATESQLLFEKRRACMLEDAPADDTCDVDSVDMEEPVNMEESVSVEAVDMMDEPVHMEERAASILPTPPVSPQPDTTKPLTESAPTNQSDETHVISHDDETSRQMQALKRVLSHAGSPTRLKRLKPSPLHLELQVNIPPELLMPRKLLNEILKNLPEEPWKGSNSNNPGGRPSTQRSQTGTVTKARGGKSAANTPPRLPYLHQIELPPNKCTLAENDTYEDYYARRKREFATDGLLPSDRIHNASLCDHSDETCKYSRRWTIPHFHAPPEKCVSESRIYTLAAGSNSNSNRRGTRPPKDPTHEHCVYRRPGRPLTCIREGWRHQCCYWREKDRTLLLQTPPEIPSEGDYIPKVFGEVVDRRSAVFLPHLMIPVEDVGVDAEFLDDRGLSFMKELESGSITLGDLAEEAPTGVKTSHGVVGARWKGHWTNPRS